MNTLPAVRYALCIDPGSERSTMVRVGVVGGAASPWGISVLEFWNQLGNLEAADMLGDGWAYFGRLDAVLIETIPSIFGSGGSTDQLETVRWEGVFEYIAKSRRNTTHEYRGSLPPTVRITRSAARAAVTGSAKGDDADVRRGLIDAYGGKDRAFGKRCRCGGKLKQKCCPRCGGLGWEIPPGLLAGMKGSHGFAALALAFAAFRPGGLCEDLMSDWRVA